MQSAAELHHARHVQKNILSTVEALGLCIPGKYSAVLIWSVETCSLVCVLLVAVLQHYCKLKEQMEGKQFYSALKTLEQLEHTYLPPVKGLATESYNVHALCLPVYVCCLLCVSGTLSLIY